MKHNTAAATLALSAGLAFASHAAAQAKPEVLVKQREAAMILMGKYFGPLVGMARGKAPYDATVVRRNAGYLSTLDKMPWDGFSESTKGQKSEALPAIWEEPAKFKQAQERLQNEVGKLVQVSSGGDEAAVKSQIGAVGKACGGCHEHFREKR
jgi:cytochrome c556